MIRKIIQIDKQLCNGCGACATACHESAIAMVDGKAALLHDNYCDGLGDCLPVCPTGAITFTQRDAAEYDEQAVLENKKKASALPCGCPSAHSKTIHHSDNKPSPLQSENSQSQLSQWPVQIKLVPAAAPYFNNANLLIAADCCAYAYGGFHEKFIKNHITVIGCPKLDSTDYSDKLTEIIKNNNIKSVTIVKMQVPCCNGIEAAAKTALQNSGKFIPWQVVTISTDGEILN